MHIKPLPVLLIWTIIQSKNKPKTKPQNIDLPSAFALNLSLMERGKDVNCPGVTPGWVYPVLLPRTPMNALTTTFQVIMSIPNLRQAIMNARAMADRHCRYRTTAMEATHVLQNLVTILFEGCKPSHNFFDALMNELHDNHVTQARANLITNPIQQLSWVTECAAQGALADPHWPAAIPISSDCLHVHLAPHVTVWEAIDTHLQHRFAASHLRLLIVELSMGFFQSEGNSALPSYQTIAVQPKYT